MFPSLKFYAASSLLLQHVCVRVRLAVSGYWGTVCSAGVGAGIVRAHRFACVRFFGVVGCTGLLACYGIWTAGGGGSSALWKTSVRRLGAVDQQQYILGWARYGIVPYSGTYAGLSYVLNSPRGSCVLVGYVRTAPDSADYFMLTLWVCCAAWKVLTTRCTGEEA